MQFDRNSPTAPWGYTKHGARATHETEVRAFALTRFLNTANAGVTTSYFPRFKNRKDPIVRHATLNTFLPEEISGPIFKQVQDALARVPQTGIRYYKPEMFHLTTVWLNPGVNPAGDIQKLQIARNVSARIREIASRIPPIEVEIDGFTVMPNQLVATYTADSWNRILDTMAFIRKEIPEFDGGYPLTESPVERGAVLQSTVAVFDGTIDTDPIIRAMLPYLPGGNAGPAVRPIKFKLTGWNFYEFIHSHANIQELGEHFADAPFNPALLRDASKASSAPAPSAELSLALPSLAPAPSGPSSSAPSSSAASSSS